jgi:ankyrin repeat protein
MNLTQQEEKTLLENPQLVFQLIADQKYKMNDVFMWAARKGHIAVVSKMLEEVDHNQQQEMMASSRFYAFRWAAENGHIAVVSKMLEKIDRNQKQEMMDGFAFHAFKCAAENGHIAVVSKMLEEADHNHKQKMIADHDFYAFRLSAENGHIAVVSKMLEEADQKYKQEMIAVRGFHAFGYAAKNGHIAVVLKLLEEVDQNQKQVMFAAHGFYAFRSAAAKGHIAIISKIFEELDSDGRRNMLDAFLEFDKSLIMPIIDPTLDKLAELDLSTKTDNNAIAQTSLLQSAYKSLNPEAEGTNKIEISSQARLALFDIQLRLSYVDEIPDSKNIAADYRSRIKDLSKKLSRDIFDSLLNGFIEKADIPLADKATDYDKLAILHRVNPEIITAISTSIKTATKYLQDNKSNFKDLSNLRCSLLGSRTDGEEALEISNLTLDSLKGVCAKILPSLEIEFANKECGTIYQSASAMTRQVTNNLNLSSASIAQAIVDDRIRDQKPNTSINRPTSLPTEKLANHKSVSALTL